MKKKKKKPLEYSYKAVQYGHTCQWSFASSFQKGGWQGTAEDTYAYVICQDCGAVKEVKVMSHN